mmetsp:Transcript_49012/g.113574  ORF Transcript_49012/g.113574 Transcript_49012/m.113574 type:complete len:218 (+) Transcript_49012:619-1272(+)
MSWETSFHSPRFLRVSSACILSTFCSCWRNITVDSVPNSTPESKPLSASSSRSRTIVSLMRGECTPLIFCFIGKTFSWTCFGFKMSSTGSSFRDASTLRPRPSSSSTSTASVPCSTKMGSGCWKMPLLFSSVSTVCRPAVTLTMYVALLLVVLTLISCTSNIISKSSNLSAPVARIHLLIQLQSRILSLMQRWMPQNAHIATMPAATATQQPSPGKP